MESSIAIRCPISIQLTFTCLGGEVDDLKVTDLMPLWC